VEIFNSDDSRYWGTGMVNKNIETEAIESHSQAQSVVLSLPPLGAIVIKSK
jgi:1,4-alpha-glucan branching enzyme